MASNRDSRTPSTVRELRAASLLRVLRAVHEAPAPPTRAALTRELGFGRGTAATLVAELKSRWLLDERDTGTREGRGRPTGELVPHADGPVVLAVSVTHDGWTVDTVELGGGTVHSVEGVHDRRHSPKILDTIAGLCAETQKRLGSRVHALALSAPGSIYDGHIAQAPILGWDHVDALARFARLGVPLTLLNDATAAGIGEARRGAGRDTGVLLHLHADAGIGGILITGGNPVLDAHGAGGEFGHMPLAGGTAACPCGARGCWDLEVGALALTGTGLTTSSARRAAAQVLSRARRGDTEAYAAVATSAVALGRGAGALVNGHDPEVVVVSGVAAEIAEIAPEELGAAYRDALMSFRREEAPAVLMSKLGDRGQHIGTAEIAFDLVLTESLVAHGG